MYIKYYLMLVRSVLQDLWHEGCGQVADTALGFALCCITPRDHNPCAINLVKHSSPTLKLMVYCCSVADIKLCADFWRCLLTVSADIAWTIWAIQHALDYAIYGWGGAFDVAHEVTISYTKIWVIQSTSGLTIVLLYTCADVLIHPQHCSRQ